MSTVLGVIDNCSEKLVEVMYVKRKQGGLFERKFFCIAILTWDDAALCLKENESRAAHFGGQKDDLSASNCSVPQMVVFD